MADDQDSGPPPGTHMDEETQVALRQGKQRVIDEYLHTDPNVVGVGYGFRRRGEIWTDEPVIIVLVVKKLPESLVHRSRLLPKMIEVDEMYWGIDIIESGRFRLGFAAAL